MADPRMVRKPGLEGHDIRELLVGRPLKAAWRGAGAGLLLWGLFFRDRQVPGLVATVLFVATLMAVAFFLFGIWDIIRGEKSPEP